MQYDAALPKVDYDIIKVLSILQSIKAFHRSVRCNETIGRRDSSSYFFSLSFPPKLKQAELVRQTDEDRLNHGRRESLESERMEKKGRET
jgi:hypothetical protein